MLDINRILLQYGILINVGSFQITFPVGFSNTEYSCVFSSKSNNWSTLNGTYNETQCDGWIAGNAKGNVTWIAIGY